MLVKIASLSAVDGDIAAAADDGDVDGADAGTDALA